MSHIGFVICTEDLFRHRNAALDRQYARGNALLAEVHMAYSLGTEVDLPNNAEGYVVTDDIDSFFVPSACLSGHLVSSESTTLEVFLVLVDRVEGDTVYGLAVVDRDDDTPEDPVPVTIKLSSVSISEQVVQRDDLLRRSGVDEYEKVTR